MSEPHNNQELFSNYYLNERLPKRSIWKEAEGIEEAYQDISRRYEDKKDILSSTKETQTEEEWIKPIFTHILNLYYIPGPSAPIFKTSKEPDYAFFLTEKIKNEAYNKQGKEELFDQAIAVGDAKRWDKDLNQIRPNKQIDNYLRITDTRWGILTNGRLWRIYNIDSSYKLDVFYEVDLIQLIEQGNLEAFKYFYLFFRCQALVKDGFLDQVYEESEDYSEAVSSDLRESVYGALQQICQGFLDGNQDLTLGDLEEIYQNALILLYRVVFILYAESDEDKELLPMKNRDYKRSRSLRSLKERVVKQITNGEAILPTSHDYWIKLKDLFHFIDRGEERLGIYEYNGGLFDRDQHKFLEEHQIGDEYLADAIYLLTYSKAEDGFIDYRDLDVRELGSIYEGLLEHKPVIKEDKIDWELDKSERKKTGSYYTPDYIVKYIVRNTIGPLVDEIEEGFKDEVKELEEKIKESRGYNRQAYQRQLEEKKEKLRDRMLELKVLDPAMGSGHFLVEATEFLATSIADLEERFAEDEKEAVTSEKDAVGELKRQIVERSIYGVDKNPLATELAKLSLWLHTVAKGEPLSFLDHHLRTGDSLIGIEIDEMKQLPSQREDMAGLFESQMIQDLSNAIGHLIMIEEITSESREDIQTKKKEWRDVKAWIDKYKQAANVHLSTYFENEVSEDQYFKVLEAAANNNIEKVEDEPYFKQTQKIAEEKRFFHWELEFPDVFRNKRGKKKENSGFDVVIGNPPWGAKFTEEERKYLKDIYRDIIDRMTDSFMFFTRRSYDLIKLNGNGGYIVPSPFLTQSDNTSLRRFLLDNTALGKLVNLGDYVFDKDLANPSCILTFAPMADQSLNNYVQMQDIREIPSEEKNLMLNSREVTVQKIDQDIFYKVHNSAFITKGIKNEVLINELRSKFPPLESFVLGKIHRGISADLNKAFIVTKSEIRSYKLENEKCKPVLVGDSVRRYRLKEPDQFVIYLCREDSINNYPNIKSHLQKFRGEITCSEVENGRHPWYALHRPRDPTIFDSPKIVGLTTLNSLEVAIDEKNNYAMDSLYLIRLDTSKGLKERCFVALLNSSLVNFIYQYFAQEEHRILPQVKATNLNPIPIPPISSLSDNTIRYRTVEKLENLYSEGDFESIMELLENFDCPIHPECDIGTKHSDILYDFLLYLCKEMEDLHKCCFSLNLNLLDYLGSFVQDTSLGNLYIPAPGLANSLLTKTKDDITNLQIAKVSIKQKLDKQVLFITARYKPENPDEHDTDRWGYTETDPIPAMEFVDLSEDQEALIREFVPVAVEKTGGFANFRKKATKTISLIDRLEKLTLPKLEDVKDGLGRFLEVKSKAEELDGKIEKTDELIDQIVYRLYGLTEEEIEIVEEAVKN